mgnify:CR=1 FL=1
MESIYRQLQRKLNTIGMGLPETDKGHELVYLEELFSQEEAEFALKMDRGLHSAKEVAESMGISPEEAEERLESMAKHSLVLRVHEETETKYYLLPVIHGFLEFGIDRFNGTVARYFSKHFMEGMGNRFYGASEPLFRIIPLRRDIVTGDKCLDVDDMEAIVRRQNKIAVTPCFCRTSSNMNPNATGCHLNPDYSELCLAFGTFAEFYVENGNGRYITTEEALEHMRLADANGNVVEILNTQDVEVMCCCCPCCCGVIKALKMFGGPAARVATNYRAHFESDKCIGCGKCTERCFVDAVKKTEKGLVYAAEECIGCGLCATTCPSGALTLERKPDNELYTPPTKTAVDLYDYVSVIRRKTFEI